MAGCTTLDLAPVTLYAERGQQRETFNGSAHLACMKTGLNLTADITFTGCGPAGGP
jgi:hypothetical protein